MSITTQKVNISLVPSIAQRPQVFCSQLDDEIRVIEFEVYTDAEFTKPATLAGLSATIEGTKPSKKGFSIPCDVVGPQQTVITRLNVQMTAEAGVIPCEIVFTDSSGRIGSGNFVLVVEKAGLAPDADISKTELPIYIGAAQEAAEQAAASATAAKEAQNAAETRAEWAYREAERAEDRSLVAAQHATQARLSQEAAEQSATDAAASASEAQALADTVSGAVQTLEDNAEAIASAAANAQAAELSAQAAEQSATDAAASASEAQALADTVSGAVQTLEDNAEAIANAATNAQAAQASADLAKSWAVGPSAPESAGTDSDNAKYWAYIAQQYAGQFTSGVVYRGSINFNEIPTSGMINGDMYNIKDAFTTDARFHEGAGIQCVEGTDIIWADDENQWNLLTPSGVSAFNGRKGEVAPQAGDYTPQMVGANFQLKAEISDTAGTNTTIELKNGEAIEGDSVVLDNNEAPYGAKWGGYAEDENTKRIWVKLEPATAPTASAPGKIGGVPPAPANATPGQKFLNDNMQWSNLVVPVDPATEPTENGAIWIVTE